MRYCILIKFPEQENGYLRWLAGEVRWLDDVRWQHIVDEHWDNFISRFGQKTEKEIQDMITETVKSGTKSKIISGEEIHYVKKFMAKDGILKEIKVVVSDTAANRGKIITAFPYST